MQGDELRIYHEAVGELFEKALSSENGAIERLEACCLVFGYKSRIYANASKMPPEQGVYVFIDGAIIRYIGKSCNAFKRCQQRPFEYDSIGFVPCDDYELALCEIRLISILIPQFNSQTKMFWGKN